MAVALALPHRFTVEDFERMVEAGILTKEDRVELIQGQVVEMSPIGKRHASAVNRATRVFIQRCGDRAIVSVQGPVQLVGTSQVQPDIALLRPREDFYRDQYPQVADVLLIVEFADSSLLTDRNLKLPAYAAAGVKEVWLVNLLNDTIEIYRDPAGGRYATSDVVGLRQRIAPLALSDLELRAEELLGL
jgi:Uma2 family endonuclease